MTPLQPLEGSTSIAATGYDVATQTLAVKFQNGGVYQYPGVSPDLADGLRTAKSAGRYLRSEIQSQFTGERVTEDEAEA